MKIEELKSWWYFKVKIHSKHHLKVTEVENSFQSSLSGYNSDLSKMRRIQEIRRNVMNKSSNSKIIF